MSRSLKISVIFLPLDELSSKTCARFAKIVLAPRAALLALRVCSVIAVTTLC